jgi:subtilisin family serine protease
LTWTPYVGWNNLIDYQIWQKENTGLWTAVGTSTTLSYTVSVEDLTEYCFFIEARSSDGVSSFSNFGKQNVDLFAPGDDIYTCIADNGYEIDGGTSLAAPMVSGTAALIWLYYPNLSVQEVKQIILESGVTIDKKVIKPGTKDELVPFSELCKSGKTLNTYNAMKMAKQMSKKK